MMANQLLLNSTKTETIWCSSPRRQHLIPIEHVRISNISFTPIRCNELESLRLSRVETKEYQTVQPYQFEPVAVVSSSQHDVTDENNLSDDDHAGVGSHVSLLCVNVWIHTSINAFLK